MAGHDDKSNIQSQRASEHALPASRTIFYYVLLVTAAISLVMVGDKGRAGASQATVVIKMVDMPPMFEPTEVTIKPGESVEWENVGNEVHHATSDPSLAIKSNEVANPPGTEPFDSGFLRPGETFTHTFAIAGVYKYACVVHEAKGMIGEVVVK